MVALTVNVKQRTGIVTGTIALGANAMDASRAVTDTLAPGRWANDPASEIVQWGAQCGTAPNLYICGYIFGSNR